MDLQALRYAAMVTNMTFQQAVEAHQHYLADRGLEGDARERILSFLDWAEAANAAPTNSQENRLVPSVADPPPRVNENEPVPVSAGCGMSRAYCLSSNV